MQNVFIYAFRVSVRQWRITAIVYFLQLCLALTIGIQVYEVLQASIGNSLEINKLLTRYDHTVITDFLKVHGASVTPLIGELRWLLLVWLIFSIFINGGLLNCAAEPAQASGLFFWQNGARYFFPFLKISLFFLLLTLLWTLAIWLPMLTFLERSLQYFSSEKYTVWLVLLLLVVWLSGLAFLFIWSVLSRLRRLQADINIMTCIKSGRQIFRKRKSRFLGLFAGLLILQLILVSIYFFLESATGMTSPFSILLFFVLQQMFVFFRIHIRQMLYAGLHFTMAIEPIG